MCGIFGYIGSNNTPETIHNGLKRLEYRGYDSWGIAISKENELHIDRKTGPIAKYDKKKLSEHALLGIGHTRWATHGGVTENNAHPHLSTDKRFTLAQNGIVENFQELKADLQKKGYEFVSETDTEVIVRLIESIIDNNKSIDLLEATRQAFLRLEGRNTIILLDSERDEIIAIRNGSPLVIGINEDEIFIASDTLSFSDKTNRIVTVANNEIIHASDEVLQKYDACTGNEIEITESEVDFTETAIDKDGFDHFMIKEIHEQQHTVREAVQYTLAELKPLIKAVKNSDNVYTVGAGTASYAAAQIAWYLRDFASINATPLKAYEVDSYRELFTKNDLILAVSQSGETADTIEALEYAQEKGVTIASIVNMVGSTISRMSDISYLTRSGPEICVASTKAFTAQISWGYLLAQTIAGSYSKGKSEIEVLAKSLKEYTNSASPEKIKQLASNLKNHNHAFVLGRENNYQIALEGALKIKEITYLHYEGFAGGELKHGVIALVEEGTPVIAIISDDDEKADMISAIAEVKARGAFAIAIATEDNELFDEWIPAPKLGKTSSIFNIIPFQLLSYYLAIELDRDPDKPRNLAKSVTVK